MHAYMKAPSAVGGVQVQPIPFVSASRSYIEQTVGIGWVDEGFSAEVWFSVDFQARSLQLGPPGTPLLNADRVNYFDNQLYIDPGNSFQVSLEIGSGAVSNARLWVENTWIRVKGVSSGTPVPEFTPWILLAVVFLVAVPAFRVIRRAHRL